MRIAYTHYVRSDLTFGVLASSCNKSQVLYGQNRHFHLPEPIMLQLNSTFQDFALSSLLGFHLVLLSRKKSKPGRVGQQKYLVSTTKKYICTVRLLETGYI